MKIAEMKPRTPDQIRDEAIRAFVARARDKYNQGQLEHGGILDENVKWEDLEDEIIDHVFYFYSKWFQVEERIGALERDVEYWKGKAEYYKELASR